MKPSLCCLCKSAEAEEQQREMQTAQLPLSHSIQVFILTISSRSKPRILCCGTNLQFQALCHLHHPRNLAAEFSPYSFGKLGTKTDATHWQQQSNTTFISSGTRNAAITAWPWMLKYEELDGQEQLVGHVSEHSQGNHPRKVTAYIPSSSSLNVPCCPKVGYGARRLADSTQGDCSGQEPYLWASYLLLPGSPLPAHSDSQFSSVFVIP